jgi:pantoate--beta-alanine ligase
MKLFTTQEELKKKLESYSSKIIGFVPTMGALHKGHISLIRKAKKESDIVVCSIFVNPTQFNESSDFENYPVTHDEDIALLKKAGCDILYIPESVHDVYSNEKSIQVNLGSLAEVMEGANRPGHFDGVVQVVSVLFDIVKPDKAFFGLKDFQQYCIIKKMVSELKLDIEVVGCPIIREESGLAMSSRNILLSKKEKEDALIINETLKFLQKEIKAGKISDLLNVCKEKLSAKGELEYLTVAELNTLQSTEILEKGAEYRAFVVSRLGNVRLIDNIEIFV